MSSGSDAVGGASSSMLEWREALERECERRDINLVTFDSVVSTNDSARRIADEYLKESQPPPRCVLAAWEQRGGRGRQGRNWVSPPGQGVYASWLEPFDEPARKSRFPLVAAITLSECIETMLETPCRIRWPNDLMVDDGKIGGILIESIERGAAGGTAIIGFGINYAHAEDAVPGRKIAAIRPLSEGRLALGGVAAALIGALADGLDDVSSQASLASRYRSRSAHKEGDPITVRAGDADLRGIFCGFDDQGRLRLKTEAGEERLMGSGEIGS